LSAIALTATITMEADIEIAADDRPPDQERGHPGGQGNEHQPERRPVGEALPRRLGILGLLDWELPLSTSASTGTFAPGWGAVQSGSVRAR
jgi:hypothetical protein